MDNLRPARILLPSNLSRIGAKRGGVKKAEFSIPRAGGRGVAAGLHRSKQGSLRTLTRIRCLMHTIRLMEMITLIWIGLVSGWLSGDASRCRSRCSSPVRRNKDGYHQRGQNHQDGQTNQNIHQGHTRFPVWVFHQSFPLLLAFSLSNSSSTLRETLPC